VGFPSLASEFPNDNAEISGGSIWVCAELTGPATLQQAPYQPVASQPFVLFFDDDEGYVDGPVVLEVSAGGLSVAVHTAESATEAATGNEAAPPTEGDPQVDADHHAEVESDASEAAPAFAQFEKALATALMAKGASRAAALVPHLLRLDSLPADALSKDVLLTLQSRGYLDGNARYSQKFRTLCGAWSAVLHGSSQDFGACGTTTLDRFGADLLAALLAVPATRADELRRELRKAGIAAFGVLEAA
jgi:hypothetical protein